MRRSRCLAVAAAALLALPGAAAAAGTSTGTVISPTQAPSPFAPGVPQSASPLPATTTGPPVYTAPNAQVGAVTTTGAGGFSTLDGVLVGVGVALLIGGIAIFVWRDSRSAARRLPQPAATSAAAASGRGRGGSKAARPKKLSAREKQRRKRGRAPRGR